MIANVNRLKKIGWPVYILCEVEMRNEFAIPDVICYL